MTEIRIEPIHTVPGMGRALIEHDPASRAFSARALLGTKVVRRSKTWRRPGPYDQGQTSTCVGQTCFGILNTSPITPLNPLARRRLYPAKAIYAGAQLSDQWPGEEPVYEGTSALGAMKFLKREGMVREYRWCFSLDDVLDTLSEHGPVGIGVRWTDGMMDTDGDGYIRPTGDEVGGHEVELHGLNVKGRYVLGTNSWGSGWGVKGRFKLSWDDLGSLLDDDGDAVTVVS